MLSGERRMWSVEGKLRKEGTGQKLLDQFPLCCFCQLFVVRVKHLITHEHRLCRISALELYFLPQDTKAHIALAMSFETRVSWSCVRWRGEDRWSILEPSPRGRERDCQVKSRILNYGNDNNRWVMDTGTLSQHEKWRPLSLMLTHWTLQQMCLLCHNLLFLPFLTWKELIERSNFREINVLILIPIRCRHTT